MRDGMVEVRETYYKRPDGSMWMRRQVGSCVLWEGPSPVVFINWSAAWKPWDLVRKPAVSLVKEAPKAMVLWREPCTTL
jgi:hypothetical protein